MAATRLIALHQNKGKTIAQSLGDRTDYAKNPEKTEKGELVTAYQCDPFTVDEDFMLSKRKYEQSVGRQQKGNVIAYQIRQSFKPGEITPEKANQVGQELAMRFTKGKHAFIVATHTDKAHIHNHIVFNSTAIDGSRKFKNFWFSGLALQKLSDLICLENGLSIITPKPYREREKRATYPERVNHRDVLCAAIEKAFEKKPKSFDGFLEELKQEGYKIRLGKRISVKGKSQKRFIRLDSLPTKYQEDSIRKLFGDDAQVIINPFEKKKPLGFIIDIQEEVLRKGPAYVRWASRFNRNQIGSAIFYASTHNIASVDEYRAHVDMLAGQKTDLLNSVKQAEARLTEIAALRNAKISYAKYKPLYDAYRKSGYSKKFLQTHNEEIKIFRAAKDVFDTHKDEKIPSVKELNAMFAEVLTQKKEYYAKYRRASELHREALVNCRNYAAMVGLKENMTEDQSQKNEKRDHTR